MKLYLTVGNIGCGKSSFAKKLQEHLRAIRIDYDELNEMFGEYNHNFVRKLAVDIFDRAITHNRDIIISNTNINQKARKFWLDRAKEYGLSVVCFDFGKIAHINNRMKSPRGKKIEDWHKVANYFEEQYEEPYFSEGISTIIPIKDWQNFDITREIQ